MTGLSRKVEIIKLERMLASEIQQIQKKLLHNKEVDQQNLMTSITSQ
jgi:hypothetical protein